MRYTLIKVNELNVELRAYLMETTLPTVIIALERLLKELARRKIVDIVKGNYLDVLAPAADISVLDKQIDKPSENAFDSINWIGKGNKNSLLNLIAKILN